MALIVKTIGSGAGRDYSTVNAWEASLPANLVTDGNSYEGDCYNDSTFNVSSSISFSGHTTDATHTITLTTGAGQSFRDNASIQTTALTYNAALGVALNGQASYSTCLIVSDDYFTVSGIQIKANQSSHCFGLTLSGAHNNANFCIQTGDRGSFSLSSGVARNCLVIGRSGTGGISLGSNTGASVYNCTVIQPSDDTSSGAGIGTGYGMSGTVIENCAIFGFPTAVLPNGNGGVRPLPTIITSMTDQVSPGFTGLTGSITYANQFQGVTIATQDFRAKAGADIIDGGTADSTNAATDIAKTARAQGASYDIGCWEYIIQLDVKTIGSAGGRDYSTVAAWEAFLPANLKSTGKRYEGDCYNDSEFTSVNVTFSGHTTDSGYKITLTTGPGQSFRDNAGAQTNPLKYDVTKGVGLSLLPQGNGTSSLVISDRDFLMSNLQIKRTGQYSDVVQVNTSAGTGNSTVENCIIEGATTVDATHAVVNMFRGGTVRNCLVIGRATTGPIIQFGNYASEAINCTFVAPSDTAAAPYGCFVGYTSATLKNCAIFGATSTIHLQGGGTAPATTCMTDQTSPPSGFTQVTYTSQFQNTLDATRDFRAKPGADILDAGTADSTNAAKDIVGTSRPQGAGYDIGAWELIVTAAAFIARLPYIVAQAVNRASTY